MMLSMLVRSIKITLKQNQSTNFLYMKLLFNPQKSTHFGLKTVRT